MTTLGIMVIVLLLCVLVFTYILITSDEKLIPITAMSIAVSLLLSIGLVSLTHDDQPDHVFEYESRQHGVLDESHS